MDQKTRQTTSGCCHFARKGYKSGPRQQGRVRSRRYKGWTEGPGARRKKMTRWSDPRHQPLSCATAEIMTWVPLTAPPPQTIKEKTAQNWPTELSLLVKSVLQPHLKYDVRRGLQGCPFWSIFFIISLLRPRLRFTRCALPRCVCACVCDPEATYSAKWRPPGSPRRPTRRRSYSRQQANRESYLEKIYNGEMTKRGIRKVSSLRVMQECRDPCQKQYLVEKRGRYIALL